MLYPPHSYAMLGKRTMRFMVSGVLQFTPTCPSISVQHLGENPEPSDEVHLKYILCRSLGAGADMTAPSKSAAATEMRYMLV